MRTKLSVEELLARYAAGEREFPDVWITSGDLSGCDLSGSNLERSFFCDIEMNGAIIRNANLRETYLQFFSWSNVDFTGSDFSVPVDYDSSLTPSSCFFRRCNFTDTIWVNRYLDDVNFVECNFTNANLTNVGCLNVTFSNNCIFTGTSKSGLYNDWSWSNRFVKE